MIEDPDNTAKVWDSVSGQNLLTLKGHNPAAGAHAVFSVAFSPDGRRIVTCNEDQSATIWDASTGEELLALNRHATQIHSAVFSPDGFPVTKLKAVS